MKGGFFLRVRSEWGPGLRNRIDVRLWSGRPGAESDRDDRGLWLTTYINLDLGSRMNGVTIPPTRLLGVYMEMLYFSPC
jgi:hypothetical protein